MKGFDPTAGHPFEEPFITYHVNRAKSGHYDSALWLRDNVVAADREGRPVDINVRFFVDQMRKGGLRKSRRMKGRGERGPGLGDHRQLLLAREMWKQVNVAGRHVTKAADTVSERYKSSPSSAIAAYYRFTAHPKEPHDRRMLRIELERHIVDCIANVDEWHPLTANNADALRQALQMVEAIKD